MSTEPRKADNTVTIVLIVVGAILLLVLLGVLACAGIAYFGFRNVQKSAASAFQVVSDTIEAQSAVESFFQHLRSGNTAAAYAATSSNWKAKYTLEQFQDYLDRHPVLKQGTTVNSQPVAPASSSPTIRFRVVVLDDKGKEVTFEEN